MSCLFKGQCQWFCKFQPFQPSTFFLLNQKFKRSPIYFSTLNDIYFTSQLAFQKTTVVYFRKERNHLRHFGKHTYLFLVVHLDYEINIILMFLSSKYKAAVQSSSKIVHKRKLLACFCLRVTETSHQNLRSSLINMLQRCLPKLYEKCKFKNEKQIFYRELCTKIFIWWGQLYSGSYFIFSVQPSFFKNTVFSFVHFRTVLY